MNRRSSQRVSAPMTALPMLLRMHASRWESAPAKVRKEPTGTAVSATAHACGATDHMRAEHQSVMLNKKKQATYVPTVWRQHSPVCRPLLENNCTGHMSFTKNASPLAYKRAVPPS